MKILNSHREKSIARQTLRVSLGLIVFTIVLIEIISYRLISLTIREQAGNLIDSGLELAASNVQNFLNKYDNLIQNIYMNQSYVENLKPINLWDNRNYANAKHEIDESLQDLCFENNDSILGIEIVGEYGDSCFYDSMSKSSNYSFCFKTEDKDLAKYAMKSRNTVYSNALFRRKSEYGEKHFFYIAHQLTDLKSYQNGSIGCVVICVDEAALRSVYYKNDSSYSITLIADGQGKILSAPVDRFVGKSVSAGSEELSEKEIEENSLNYIQNYQILGKGRLKASSRNIQGTDFYVVNVRNETYLLRNLRYFMLIIVLIGLLAAIICIWVLLFYADSINHSVRGILFVMDASETDQGGCELRIMEDRQHWTEFERIGRHFNKMMDAIADSRKQEKEALVREKNAEIRSLEAQINPHFLYNTLDSINWVAIGKNEFKISNMLGNLSVFLRYSIQKSNGETTIKDLLIYLKKYIYLQQQRFDVICSIDFDEEIENIKIHKLLVQPLLENALEHAFPGDTGMDEVDIQIRAYEDSKIRILIRDNGKGMKQEDVDYFNSFDYRKDKMEGSIGIRNVITRIHLYYGELASFHIASGNEGTLVEMIIPVSREDGGRDENSHS